LGGIEAVLDDLPPDRAGVRLQGRAALAGLLAAAAPIGSVAATALGPDCFPVRAILFDKTQATNWTLGWHQDRTIAVRERAEVPGFGPWTRKGGMVHVAPPAAVLARMVTLRIHLDPVPDTNAPLLIARGSHRLGAVAEREIDEIVAESDVFACLAERGDIWLYATLILHASAASARPARRRVLQVDYAAKPLPGGLHYLGV
jgi:ectoine hydroxylase-related dioxygenase (phytanoyl-CoA dioxygenase family)